MAATSISANRAFFNQLRKYYTWYTGGFLAFLLVLAVAEQLGLSRQYIGYAFLGATIALYAGIGIMSRTADVAEYYVAGRRVPAFFNGMATGADWMSAASFIGMAGTLYLAGFDGLSFVMGWTGGYCLVAFLLAPYLRKFGQFTIPDFLGARYGGNIVRSIGIVSAIVCSFVYVVAQIYGVGLITSRFTGLAFEVGVFVGLAGILVCSMLGGMRAVTWTQVAQYIILIIAYLTPVVWLGLRYTGIPVPQFAYGQTMEKLAVVEKKIMADPKEAEVRAIFKSRADTAAAALKDPAKAFPEGKVALEKRLADLRASGAPAPQIDPVQKALTEYPTDIEKWKAAMTKDRGLAARAAPLRPHAQPYPGATEQARDTARLNFIGIVFCMMFGTAALPHILMRYYTTPSVQQARDSVFWSLFFIFLLYFTAPCLAVLAKYDVYTNLVGSSFAALPAWAAQWAVVDPTLLNITDVNRDGIVQLAEIVIGTDLIVLATPEIAGLPYVVSGLVAAGGLGGRALNCGRVAADDLERPLARPVLQDDRPIGFDQIPRHAVQGAAGGGRDRGGGRHIAEAGRYLVPGRRGVLARGVSVLPAAGAGRVLEARDQVGGDHRHGRWARGMYLLHDAHLPVLHEHGRTEDGSVVRAEPDLGRDVRTAGGADHDHHRQSADARARSSDAGAGRARALSAPAR